MQTRRRISSQAQCHYIISESKFKLSFISPILPVCTSRSVSQVVSTLTNASFSAPFPLSAVHCLDGVVNKGHLRVSHAACILLSLRYTVLYINQSSTQLVAQILLQRALGPNKLYISTIPARARGKSAHTCDQNRSIRTASLVCPL